MRLPTCLMALAAPLALAACGSEEEAEVAETPMAAEEMPAANAGEAGQVATAEGTVTAVNEEAGTVTIDHGPVEAVGWPAMTMAFDADEGLRQQVKVGDDVNFDFRMSDQGNEIISIRQR